MILFNQQTTIWLLRQSLHIKTKSFGPPKQKYTNRKSKGRGRRGTREREGEEFSILYNFTVIKYYFKIEAKQTDTERETEKGREKGLKPLFVCLSCARCCWIGGNYTFYYDTVRLQSVFCPPAPHCSALCRPQLVWFTSELALCGIRENQTETERYRDRDRTSSKSKLWQEVQAEAKSKSSFSMQSELEKASSMRRHATQKASQWYECATWSGWYMYVRPRVSDPLSLSLSPLYSLCVQSASEVAARST